MLSFPEILVGQSLLLAIGFLIGAGVLALVAYANARLSRILAFSFTFIGCVFGLIAGAATLLGTTIPPIVLGSMPGLGSLVLSLDPLSAFFAILISIAGAAVSIYSFGYMDEYEKKGYSSALFGFLFSLFLLSMLSVVVAQNALLFLVFWELMALSSYFLVTYENKEEGAKKAGFSYLLITHVGAAALILMFLALAGSAGSLDFASFRTAPLTSLVANAIFVLSVIAFGSKAGIIPLHIWLPEAHPQAPSNISALMSGVMLKVAIYGLIRVVFDFLPHIGTGTSGIQMWWGVLILLLGVVSSVLGVLYALTQNDLKRLLAFSSVENIGIIFIGIGAAIIFYYLSVPALAALALFAALYHTFNHSIFKSLLFLGAGSVLHATHTRDTHKLGGLIKKMPVTAILFFVGAISISALPPLNGFVSEWITFQSLFAGLNSSGLTPLIFGAAILLLAITSALAAAAFIKAFGMTFLGMARSKHAEEAHESNFSMQLGMAILAVACVLAGVLPVAFYGFVSPVFSTLNFAAPTALSAQAAASKLPALDISTVVSALPSLDLFIIIAVISVLVVAFLAVLRAMNSGRASDEVRVTWDCGIQTVTPQMEYTPTSLAMPIRRAFERWLNPLNSAHAYGSALFEAILYRPLVGIFKATAPWSSVFQTGKLGHYLMYMLIALIVIMLYAVAM